jgi:hypothetical protein
MLASLTNLDIVDRVNEKLPKEEQLVLLGWHSLKYPGLYREYKRLYPDGRLLFKVRLLTGLSFACILICVWGFGIFAT